MKALTAALTAAEAEGHCAARRPTLLSSRPGLLARGFVESRDSAFRVLRRGGVAAERRFQGLSRFDQERLRFLDPAEREQTLAPGALRAGSTPG